MCKDGGIGQIFDDLEIAVGQRRRPFNKPITERGHRRGYSDNVAPLRCVIDAVESALPRQASTRTRHKSDSVLQDRQARGPPDGIQGDIAVGDGQRVAGFEVVGAAHQLIVLRRTVHNGLVFIRRPADKHMASGAIVIFYDTCWPEDRGAIAGIVKVVIRDIDDSFVVLVVHMVLGRRVLPNGVERHVGRESKRLARLVSMPCTVAARIPLHKFMVGFFERILFDLDNAVFCAGVCRHRAVAAIGMIGQRGGRRVAHRGNGECAQPIILTKLRIMELIGASLGLCNGIGPAIRRISESGYLMQVEILAVLVGTTVKSDGGFIPLVHSDIKHDRIDRPRPEGHGFSRIDFFEIRAAIQAVIDRDA